MSNTAVFIMPLKISGNETELRHFREAVDSIRKQTDPDWRLVIIDDHSDDPRVYDALDNIEEELKDKVHVIRSLVNCGAGATRNKGIAYAAEIGAPFILFLDADDICAPQRLALCRKAFNDPAVNVVYTSFDVIDENGSVVPYDRISLTVREIIDGHRKDVVEGENAWISIAMKKKYTNLTSCTAVRTTLASEELFPPLSVSEDCHTWFRYAAHPGKFVFLPEIKGGYRICSGMASRSRSLNADFYEKMFRTDIDGFEAAVKLAEKFGTMGGYEESEIRAVFYVRLALNLLHGNSLACCRKALETSAIILPGKTIGYIDGLDCAAEDKAQLKEMLK